MFTMNIVRMSGQVYRARAQGNENWFMVSAFALKPGSYEHNTGVKFCEMHEVADAIRGCAQPCWLTEITILDHALVFYLDGRLRTTAWTVHQSWPSNACPYWSNPHFVSAQLLNGASAVIHLIKIRTLDMAQRAITFDGGMGPCAQYVLNHWNLNESDSSCLRKYIEEFD